MKELVKRLDRLQTELIQNFPQWANVALGNTALALLKKRVVETGVSADGSSYSPYSTKPTLVGAKSFRTKAAAASVFGSPSKRRQLQWVTYRGYRLAVLPGGYKQIRQIEGSQVSHKSFLRSGEMWLSIHTLGTNLNNGVFITKVGSQDELSNKKLEGNVKRENKDILDVSSQEEKTLGEVLDKYITNMVNKAING